jgi:site-specific recombinase XerD
MGFHSPICWEDGYDLRTIQDKLAQKDVKTTMIYNHVLNRGVVASEAWPKR